MDNSGEEGMCGAPKFGNYDVACVRPKGHTGNHESRLLSTTGMSQVRHIWSDPAPDSGSSGEGDRG